MPNNQSGYWHLPGRTPKQQSRIFSQGSQESLTKSTLKTIALELCQMWGEDGRGTLRQKVWRIAVEHGFNEPESFGDDQFIAWCESFELVASRRIQRENLNVDRTRPSAGLKNGRRKNKQIVLLSPGIEQPFYTEVLEKLTINASKLLDGECQVLPLIPKRNFDSLELWSMLEKVRNGKIHADGLILIPDFPETHVEEIKDFIKFRPDIPLILFDVFFDLDCVHTHFTNEIPYFVGGSETEGGRIAGEIAINHLKKFKVSNPKLLILLGSETPWEAGRSDGFSKAVIQAFPNAHIIPSPPLDYNRMNAYSHCLQIFDAEDACQLGWDLIFACNDHMALGACSAIAKAKRQKPNGKS